MGTFPKLEFMKQPDRNKERQIGIVVNNKDPKKLGAIQVRVPGLIDGKDNVLPWASSIQPPGLGGSSNSKNVAVPNVGSQVILHIIDQYTIYYTGFLQTGKINNDTLGEDYPNTYGYTDEQGTGWRINRKQQYMEATHSSGSKVRLTKEGDILITSARDVILNAGRDIKISASNELAIKCQSYKNNNQVLSVQSQDNASYTSSGPLSVTGSPLSLNG